MIAVVLGVALFTTISQADDKCKGGNINQHLCQKTCNLTSCSCDMTDISPFTSCAQKCHFFSSCPEMVCSGKPYIFSCKENQYLVINSSSRSSRYKHVLQGGIHSVDAT